MCCKMVSISNFGILQSLKQGAFGRLHIRSFNDAGTRQTTSSSSVMGNSVTKTRVMARVIICITLIGK